MEKNRERNKRTETGITLIALIITIIILLILAGVTINLLTGENGLIAKVLEAKSKNSLAQEKELITLAVNSTKIRVMTEENAVEEEIFSEELDQNFGQGVVKLESQGNSNYQISIETSGRIYAVNLSTGEIEVVYDNGKVSYAKREDYKDVPDTDASYFEFDETTGTITSLANIEGYYAQEVTYPTTIKIPEKINGVKVTSIALSKGAMITEVTDVVIPETVTVIEQEAFHNMTGLKNVVMPSKLEKIKISAFSNCKSMETIEIPDTVNLIEEYAFTDTANLKEITITSDNINIGEHCFQNSGIISANITGNNIGIDTDYYYYIVFNQCYNLIKVKMGQVSIPNVTRIYDEGVIQNCPKLKNVEIENAKGIVIKDCNALETVKIGNLSGELGIKYCNSLKSLVIEKSTDEATLQVHNCSDLKEITIPNSVKEYGSTRDTICDSLSGLEKLTIPADFTGLTGDIIYEKMPALKEIVIPNGGNYVFEDGVLYNKDKTEVIWVSYTNENATQTISASGELTASTVQSYYTEGDNIRVLKIAEGVTKIADNAFASNGGAYAKIILPSTLIEIGDNAFSGCEHLIEMEIPEGVTSIGNSAFEGCRNLINLNIPESVTNIGKSAFSGCENLKSMNIPEGVKKIGNDTFNYCKNLTSINIPEGVTSIGDSAFNYCQNLTSINIPEGVTGIGNYAFCSCTSLTSINIPPSVTSIGNYAFEGCRNLINLNIPEGVTSIGDSAFYNCQNLTSINIPPSVTSIGNYAFGSCTRLTSINIPDSVTSIGNYAFRWCTSLISINIPPSVTSIGNYAFSSCIRLTSINIPTSVTSIGKYAFSACDRLTIYCEAPSKPNGWDSMWNSGRPVIWGYKQ